MGMLLKKLYRPRYMVKDSLKLGAIPSTREGYSATFAIAWAAIAETFLIALVGMSDTAMISVIGEHAIAAVAMVNQPRYLAQTLIFALNIAITAICARQKGAENRDGANGCLKQGMMLSAVFSVLLSVLFYPFAGKLIGFMGAKPDTIELATEYFRILIIGLPLANMSHTISSAQRGVGETRASMFINLTANIVNIVLNFFLISGKWIFPRLEVRGAAIATVIGWGAGLVVGIISITRREQFLSIKDGNKWKFDKETLTSIKNIGVGSFVEQAAVRFGFISYARVVIGLDTLVYAAHEILMNLMSLSFSFGDGFGIAASSLVGQNLGAKRPDLSIVYGKICQRMSIISSAVLFVVFGIWGRSLVMLFSKNPVVLEVSEKILVIMGLIIFAQASQMVFMGALRGAGDTKYTAIISMISIMIIRPILSRFLAYDLDLGLVGAWIGMAVDQYLRLILTYNRFSRGNWMTEEHLAPIEDEELPLE